MIKLFADEAVGDPTGTDRPQPEHWTHRKTGKAKVFVDDVGEKTKEFVK